MFCIDTSGYRLGGYEFLVSQIYDIHHYHLATIAHVILLLVVYVICPNMQTSFNVLYFHVLHK